MMILAWNIIKISTLIRRMSELISNEVVEIIAPISDRVINKLECSDAITIILIMKYIVIIDELYKIYFEN